MTEKEQTASEIIPVILGNIQKLMAKKGIANYEDLLTQCGYSAEYSALFEDSKKFNPTIKMLETMAKVLAVRVKDLADPDLQD